jgi:hypothetical protein
MERKREELDSVFEPLDAGHLASVPHSSCSLAAVVGIDLASRPRSLLLLVNRLDSSWPYRYLSECRELDVTT